MFSQRSPALLGQTGFQQHGHRCAEDTVPCHRGREHKAMGKPGGSWDTQILHGNKGSSPLLSRWFYRGQSKQLPMDVIQGAAQALRLFGTLLIHKNRARDGGVPEPPEKVFRRTLEHLKKLLRGTPSPPSHTSRAWAHPTLPQPDCLGKDSREQLTPQSDTGAQVQPREAAAASPLPAIPGQRWHGSPMEVLSSPAARWIQGAAAAVLLQRKLRLLLQSISHPITALFFF